jgi:hypothetical protein
MTRRLLIALLALLAGYGALKAWPLIAGPSIALAAPRQDASVSGTVVTVSGTVARVAVLTLDGAPLPHDESGRFSATLALPQGASVLTLEGVDRFGRRTTVERDIYVSD